MDLNQLRSFVAVAKLGHLTRAAETLHLSQPALSGQIKALEESFGVDLFQRSSSGMALTPAGRRLLVHAEAVLGAAQQLSHAAQALRGQPTGKLAFGTVLDPATLRVGELLADLNEHYPQIEVELHQLASHEALAGIRNATLDGSFYFGSQPEADLVAVPLREIAYRVALPIAWADELVDAEWEVLAARPWIVAPEGSSHRQLVRELFGGDAMPEHSVESDNESVIANLVDAGVGLSIVRDEIACASHKAKRVALWPGAEPKTTLWFAYPADRADDPLLKAVLTSLARVWPAAPHLLPAAA